MARFFVFLPEWWCCRRGGYEGRAQDAADAGGRGDHPEILVVLTIIALIAGVVGPRLIGYLGRAKSETAALQLQGPQDSLRLFYIDMGRYPSQSEGLAVLVAAPAAAGAGWRGPYLDSAKGLTDPWGRAYVYA